MRQSLLIHIADILLEAFIEECDDDIETALDEMGIRDEEEREEIKKWYFGQEGIVDDDELDAIEEEVENMSNEKLIDAYQATHSEAVLDEMTGRNLHSVRKLCENQEFDKAYEWLKTH